MHDDSAQYGRLEYFVSVLQVAVLLAGFAFTGRVLTRVAVALEAANASQRQAAVTFTTEQRVVLKMVIANKVRRMKKIEEIASLFKDAPPPRETLIIEVLERPDRQFMRGSESTRIQTRRLT